MKGAAEKSVEMKMNLEILKKQLTFYFSKLDKNKQILLVCAVFLIVIALIAFSGNAEDKTDSSEEITSEYSNLTQEEITESLELFLGKIEGAGRVEVMITFDTGTQKVYAYDSDEKKDDENGSSEINTKSEHIIVKTDDGENGLEVMEIYPKIRGVAVICDGGNDSVVKSRIVSAISALFDINTTRISVTAMVA